MNIVTIEEQTFKQVCGRFSGFVSQVERICKENTRQPDEWLSGREVCALFGIASEVCRTTGTVVNWATPKSGISCTINLPILKDWLQNVQ